MWASGCGAYVHDCERLCGIRAALRRRGPGKRDAAARTYCACAVLAPAATPQPNGKRVTRHKLSTNFTLACLECLLDLEGHFDCSLRRGSDGLVLFRGDLKSIYFTVDALTQMHVILSNLAPSRKPEE